MSGDHARLGPSNHRWPHCPGSVREEAVYPDIPGESAIDGTGSHLLLEGCMIHGVRAEAYKDQIIGVNHVDCPNGWLVLQDRIDRVQQCLDYVSTRVAELKQAYPDCTIKIESEHRSDPGSKFGRADWWGTVDITITVLSPAAEIIKYVEVIDYKDGRGYVGVEGNTQLISYAMGKIGFEIVPVRMTIVQPKTNPVVRYVDTDASAIKIAGINLAGAAARTDDPDAPLVPDDKGGKGHCQWCKHKPNCTAASQQAMEVIPMLENTGGSSLFELINETFGDITTMPNEKLTELSDARAGIEAVFAKVDAEIERRIEAGIPVEGFAMLPGRGSSAWSVSEEEVVKMLKARRLTKSEIYPASLISPAAVLKLDKLTNEQKEKISKDYIDKKKGKLTLSKVREAKATAADVFKDVSAVSFF